ncbi:MAG: hypothetical protein ACLGHO_03780 [Gammaproteobacteria bacterium]
MNIKRWFMASAAAFVALGVLEFVINGILLSDLYKQTATVWRPEADIMRMMWLMWLSYAIAAPVFAFVYTKGYEVGKGGIGQGMRFGFYLGVFLAASISLGFYAVLPIPGILAVYWFIGGVAEYIVVGAVVGAIYKP